MKLFELFEPERKELTTKSQLDISKYHSNNRNKEIGRGAFSTAYDDKDAHMVKKVSNHQSMAELDGYWQYVDALIKDGIWKSNPHFPRIYSVTKFKYKGMPLYKGTMERLIPFADCEFDEIYACLSKIVYLDEKEFLQFGDPKASMMSRVARYLDSAVSENNYEVFSSDSIKEALQWLHEFIQKYRKEGDNAINVDIHKNNIMFRRTKYGIQLVLSDPIA